MNVGRQKKQPRVQSLAEISEAEPQRRNLGRKMEAQNAGQV